MIATSERLLQQNKTQMQIQSYSSQRLKQLQGQCKVQKITLLRINYLKAIILTLLSTITVVGLLMLFYFKWFRVMIWFSDASFQQATHVYVEGGKKNDDIEIISRKDKIANFYFKKLKYQLLDSTTYFPYGFNYQLNFEHLISKQYLSQGLDLNEVKQKQEEYGMNIHGVQIPNYLTYMLETLLKPFFLLQYIVCLAYFIQGYLIFTILNLVFSLITTTINYVLTYLSYKKIQEMAEKVHIVQVFRSSKYIQVQSTQLVPGDLIVPQGQIMCDCILIKDQVYVNQASLTGQSLPIGKSPAHNLQQTEDHFKWLYEGSHVVEKRGNPLAVVIYTGYATRRGRIIRKILTSIPSSSQIFKKALYFLVEAFVVSMIIYFATLGYTKSKNISDLIIGFRFVDFLGWAFPPTFPIYFNLAYSFAAVRLKHNNILCMQPDKTVQASNIEILCFDKTGTLTQNNVQINRIYKFMDGKTIIDITKDAKQQENTFIFDLFATCHCIKYIDGEYMGDQIDLRMFLYAGYELVGSDQVQVKFQVKRKDKHALEVLRINQFQSKFQSMSVLIKNTQNNKYYVFIKGAPQKIHLHSMVKIQGFDDKIAELSLGGYRTICFGYKQISIQQIDKYIEGTRQLFEQQIIALGLVAFQNKLKHDTKSTIDKIIRSGIQPKIITGDNIFIAVQTAVRAGILKQGQKVILLQGSKQPQFKPDQPRKFKGILLTRTSNYTTQQPITLQESTDYLHSQCPIAIDNAFLCLQPCPSLTHKIKLFARISPQNKALIITKYKEMLKEEFDNKSTINKICGQLKKKVGMCGDGSNDLIAIREADIGIGVNNSDASYAATFTITELDNVDYIIRDSKATTTNIVEMIRYYQFISFLKIPSALLMQYDTTYFHESQVLYTNFTCTVIYPILQAMSLPAPQPTKAIPNGNFLGPVNQFRFWGSLIIATGGLTAGYFYFITTPEYIPNPDPIADTIWNTTTHTATCHFLLMLCPSVVYSFIFYISSPWKQPIYKNYLLFLLIIANIAATIALHYITKQTEKALGTVPISNPVISVVLGISAGACIMGLIYNLVITKMVSQAQRQQEIAEN